MRFSAADIEDSATELSAHESAILAAIRRRKRLAQQVCAYKKIYICFCVYVCVCVCVCMYCIILCICVFCFILVVRDSNCYACVSNGTSFMQAKKVSVNHSVLPNKIRSRAVTITGGKKQSEGGDSHNSDMSDVSRGRKRTRTNRSQSNAQNESELGVGDVEMGLGTESASSGRMRLQKRLRSKSQTQSQSQTQTRPPSRSHSLSRASTAASSKVSKSMRNASQVFVDSLRFVACVCVCVCVCVLRLFMW